MSRGFAYDSHFPLPAHPVHSMGSPSLPRPRFTLPMRSGAGFSHLLAIAYDFDVLGLGPDSPWGDWRCPGTLRLAVWMVLTSMTLLIPAFALVCAPPVLAVELLGGTQRSPTNACLLALSRNTHGIPQLRSDA